MEFVVKSGSPEKQRTACIVVGVYESRKLTPSAAALDELSEGFISRVLKRGDLDGQRGQLLMLHSVPNLSAERVLLVGCGKEREFTAVHLRQINANVAQRLNRSGASEAINTLTDLLDSKYDLSWRLSNLTQSASDALYRFDEFKSKPSENKKPLKKMTFCVATRGELRAAQAAVAQGASISAGSAFTRDLGNTPPNVCHPSYLAKQAKALARGQKKLQVEILDEREMKALGMGALLSVAIGSEQAPKLISMNYAGGKKGAKPVVLVGKGVTFDTGGISLKPGGGMDEMKFDMCGAATVFGVMKAVIEMDLPINLVGLVPAVENMPDGRATRPGDVVTSMSGQTIEILNTDAEGRLILCDALTYAEKYNPDVVIDIATLTGACIVALGHHTTGLMSNNDPLADDLYRAGQESGDKCWRLPIWDEYQKTLSSNFADIPNIGSDRSAGTIVAGCFLERFTKSYRWAHLDIAGVAWKSGGQKGATGRPVPMLMQYLMDRC